MQVKMIILDRNALTLAKENRTLRKDSEMKNDMLLPLKKHMKMLEDRIREYNVRGPPRSKIDLHLVCTNAFKKAEELNLLAKLNDAICHVHNKTVTSSGNPPKQDRVSITNMSDLRKRIVFDY